MKKLAIVAIVMLIVFIGVGIFAVINSFEGDMVTEAYVEPINVVKEASVLTTAENPSAKVVEGWHDESGNKYYIILLGKLEMAEIYNLDSFVYNTAIKERKIEQSTVTQDTIINTYTQHVSQTISSETVVKMENQLKVSAGLNKG
ncbi:MAG: hypothetical protein IJF71_00790, partial [Clostridia bacterium]|nr:hypothetical protein [Clostridia bacterium]